MISRLSEQDHPGSRSVSRLPAPILQKHLGVHGALSRRGSVNQPATSRVVMATLCPVETMA